MIRPAQERLFGVIGNPVGHSLSPVMMNRAFDVCGIACRYLAMEVTELEKDLDILAKVGFEGLSVTVPYKEEILKFVAGIDPEVSAIGAVNTLKRSKSGWAGRNTDWVGVVKALAAVIPVGSSFGGRRSLVVGAGGAARAVVFALKNMGMEVTIANRTLEKAELLARHFSCQAMHLDALKERKSPDWDVIVQTTSVGMKGHHEGSSPVPSHLFAPGVIAMDVVYTPRWTAFLRDAKDRGAQVVFGSEMLLHQGVAQFEWWLGVKAPVEAMREVLEKTLETREKS